MKGLGILIALTALGGSAWWGYSHFLGGDGEGLYIIKELEKGRIVRTVSATGTIEPVTKVIVGSQVSGNIKKWYADFNDQVTEGFVLAELEPDRFITAHNQAKAELAIARAREEESRVRYEDAERERKRIAGLLERATASDNELKVAAANANAAEAAWHASQAEVEAAEARLNAAAVDLDRTIIRSPIDGVVISRTIDVGQTVAASLQAPELFLIANNLTHMQVNANVAESDVGLIRENMPARFTVDAHPDRTFHGVITQIRYNPTILDGVVTYVTLIDVKNDDLALRPGMTANVTFEVAAVDDVIRVPTAAVRFSPRPLNEKPPAHLLAGSTKKSTVWIPGNGEPQPVEIELGLSDGTYSALVAGPLNVGDGVIVDRNWLAGSRRRDPSRTLR